METKTEKQFTWLTSLLSHWGIKESWAKLIAGAIIGALCAAGFLTSCSPITTEQAQLAHAIIDVMKIENCQK